MHHSGIGLGLMAGALMGMQHHACAQSTPISEFGTGALPLSKEEFAALPKTPTYRAFLPSHIDLSRRFPTPGDQGRQGSCTAWAVGYAARSYYSAAVEGRDIRDISNIPSPSYLYGTVLKDSSNCNAGSSILKVIQVLTKGAYSLKEFPYKSSECRRPTESEQHRATDFRIENWEAVDFTRIDQVKGELEKGNPVLVGMHAPREFMRLHRGETYNGTSTSDQDWHAVAIVGYDEKRQAFKLINSWGIHWADDGFGWISYGSFLTEVREAYVMRPLKPAVPAPQPVVILPPPSPPIPAPNPAPIPAPEPSPVPKPPNPIVVTNDTSCSEVTSTEQFGQTSFSGFVPTEGDLSRLRTQISSLHASVKVAVRPWPQCEVLQTLSREVSSPKRPSVKIISERGLLQKGNYLTFEIITPPFPSFLHVSYIQADGSVMTLLQSSNIDLRAYPASTPIKLGGVEGSGLRFRVSPPFGREMLLVVASRSPLFDRAQPTMETDREFLTGLRQAILARPDASSPERLITASFDTVVTSEDVVTLSDE